MAKCKALTGSAVHERVNKVTGPVSTVMGDHIQGLTAGAVYDQLFRSTQSDHQSVGRRAMSTSQRPVSYTHLTLPTNREV